MLILVFGITLLAGCGTNTDPTVKPSADPTQPTSDPTVPTDANTPPAGGSEDTEATDTPGDDFPKTGTIDTGYLIFTAQDGWYVDDVDTAWTPNHYRIKKEGKSFGGITIKVRSFTTLGQLLEDTANVINGEIIDDVTYNGVQYHAVKKSDDFFYLMTAQGAFNDDAKDPILIDLFSFTLEDAASFLETITIKDISE